MHRFAHLFVSQAERNSAPHQISSAGPGVHESGLRRFLHALAIKFDSLHPAGGEGQKRKHGSGGVKERLLGFLQIFVVGQGQAFHRDQQRGRVADDAGGFAAR